MGNRLKQLGAKRIAAHESVNETIARRLGTETWAACIDTVGGPMLARILGQIQCGSSVAALGLEGGTSDLTPPCDSVHHSRHQFTGH